MMWVSCGHRLQDTRPYRFLSNLMGGIFIYGADLSVGTFAGGVDRYRHRSLPLVNDASNRPASGLLRDGFKPENALLECRLVERKHLIGMVLGSEVHSTLGFVSLLAGRRAFHRGAG